ncbi:electron transfer flavoprotein subunit alpha/FixB family protein [Grimontia sp. S25]|uniref:Electron transfer flavoprotein subunit alpha/FixB family protein n=1 Tax=Grimontia sedimenti TaxID=2711294 RepID=A0A6M1RKN5_9GAMM|nr:electron transfer flavoprotein subunit alpha/FixB family protein [Grimontia sedimenti]NGN98368.1 electron transfer flavoprotein subunit alpha/FixB family protein [Grimontia sedimenti]
MDDIKRRDPRKEQILRNRLHPQYDEMAVDHDLLMSGGTNRKNPHKQGYLSAEGIKRIDRSGAAVAAAGIAKKQQEQSLPLRAIVNPSSHIVVFSDSDSAKLTVLDKDMLGLAHSLADDGTAVIMINLHSREDDLASAGADRALALDAANYSPDSWLGILQTIETELSPKHWIFADGTLVGGDLARRLAVSLGVRPVTRGKLYAEGTLNCGGGDASKSVNRKLSRILLVEEQVADPIAGFITEASSLDVAEVAGVIPKVTDLGDVAVDPADIPLAETRFILSGGNGIRNWALFHQCAQALGATEGASRVAVDNGHMPRTTQVGATGTYVNAKVYVAVGISGAIQHLQGMTTCETVIALNTDANCDMIKRADLSIIADSSEVMQALVDATAGGKGELDNVG